MAIPRHLQLLLHADDDGTVGDSLYSSAQCHSARQSTAFLTLSLFQFDPEPRKTPARGNLPILYTPVRYWPSPSTASGSTPRETYNSSSPPVSPESPLPYTQPPHGYYPPGPRMFQTRESPLADENRHRRDYDSSYSYLRQQAAPESSTRTIAQVGPIGKSFHIQSSAPTPLTSELYRT